MRSRSLRRGFFLLLSGCVAMPLARAQTRTQNPSLAAPQAPLPTARFGAIDIDETRATAFSSIIRQKELIRQIKALDGALVYREGALGFYHVTYEAVGNRDTGKVRVTVTIVGQTDARDGNRTLLARGQSVQGWRGGVFIYPRPTPPEEGANGPRVPRTDAPDVYPSNKMRAFPYPYPATPTLPRGNGCGNNKRDQDGNSKAAKMKDAREEKHKDEKKSDDKPAPRAEPRADAGSKKPQDKPQPVRSAPDPQPQRDTSPPPRDNTPAPQPVRSAPDPQPQRDTSPRPIFVPPVAAPPTSRPTTTRPPTVRPDRAPAPIPDDSDNPFAKGHASPPNPTPNAGDRDPNAPRLPPNPLPPSNGRPAREPQRSRPRWHPRYDPYDYPSYPYPAPYPYPRPYPIPYPVPYPYPYPDPTLPASYDIGARQGFDYALEDARAQAEADFARQLRGEPDDDFDQQW